MTTPTHTCFTVRSRGDGKKPFWAPIGSAWVRSDNGFSIRLDALPINGEIFVRPRQERDAKDEAV